MSSNSSLQSASWRLYYDREDDRPFAELIRITSQLSKYNDVQILRYPKSEYGKLPYNLRKILFFGRPDVSITYSDKTQSERAVFACEITKSEAARDHWMQRFTSSVGPCIMGVPSAIILPFHIPTGKWKGELQYDFFYAFKRVMDIHKTPICLTEWKASSEGILSEDEEIPKTPDRNSQPMLELIKFIDLVIQYAINGKDLNNLFNEQLFQTLYANVEKKITQIPKPSEYARLKLLNSEGVVTTSEMLEWLKKQTGVSTIPEKSYMREKSIIFTPRPLANENSKETLLDRIKLRNGNPYNGMPLAIDYMFCRLGTSKHDRDANLILNLSELSYDEFIYYFKKTHEASPITNDTLSPEEIPQLAIHMTEGYVSEVKDVIRQFCYAADIIVLKDCIIPFLDEFIESPKFEITEAEIHSITRRFFQKNGFRVVSRTPSGKDIHYRTSISEANYKIPDLVCFKDSIIIIAEQKIKYNDLFSGDSPDVEKINSFLTNNDTVEEFLTIMKEFNENFTKEQIIGCFSSLIRESSDPSIDQSRIYIGIEISGKNCKIKLLQSGSLEASFPIKECEFEI